MKKNIWKTAAACGMCLALLASGMTAGAAFGGEQDGGEPGGELWEQRGGCMVINEAGRYTLTGEMRGTVYVDPGEGDVTLVLDNAQIDGASGAGIVAISGDRLCIELPDGSRSRIDGGGSGAFGAAVYSAAPLTIEGGGYLGVTSASESGIYAGSVTINGGELHISAQADGIRADSVVFNAGTLVTAPQMDSFAPGTDVALNGGTLSEEKPQTAVLAEKPAFTRYTEQAEAQARDGADDDGGEEQAAPASPVAQDVGQSEQLPQGVGQQPGQPPQDVGQGGGQSQNGAAQSTVSAATEVVTGTVENSAMNLTADYDNATTYDVSENSTVKISESGTYIVTGTSDEGSITVKKGTTGVVLVLEDLDLTSTGGATLCVNKNAEVQIVVSGTVTLTDNEDPNDEYSDDADVAGAYDGAAIKVKADSVVFITGSGTLNVNGNAKNGIKSGNNTGVIIGGTGLTVNINAANDGVNGNYDVTILSGTVNINASDDGIHADHILTVGQNGKGPALTVTGSTEGLEGTVVNIAGGTINVTASDDGINAANADGAYEGELGYSVNITGGSVNVTAGTDGIDSNGNVNLIAGSVTIRSANNGGDAGIDYDGEYYVSDAFQLNNLSGVAGPDGQPGQQGDGQQSGQPGQPGQQDGGQQPGQPGQPGQQGG
ncbi:MAG: carbohydrate-binding domain-containing protein [Oscillospiraceae bacterium]|nr:carbohydrate-binding domain-containing protein [Oscillospiraceae bacterium]